MLEIKGRKNMSRIDVVPAEKNKFKVLVNFGGVACFEYSSPEQANAEAKKLKANRYQHAQLNLVIA